MFEHSFFDLTLRVNLGAMATKGYSYSGALLSDGLVSCPDHLFEEFYPSRGVQTVYFITPADWAESNLGLNPLVNVPLQK